jgi:hypothetical protein
MSAASKACQQLVKHVSSDNWALLLTATSLLLYSYFNHAGLILAAGAEEPDSYFVIIHTSLMLYSCFTHAVLMFYSCFTDALLILAAGAGQPDNYYRRSLTARYSGTERGNRDTPPPRRPGCRCGKCWRCVKHVKHVSR